MENMSIDDKEERNDQYKLDVFTPWTNGLLPYRFRGKPPKIRPTIVIRITNFTVCHNYFTNMVLKCVVII